MLMSGNKVGGGHVIFSHMVPPHFSQYDLPHIFVHMYPRKAFWKIKSAESVGALDPYTPYIRLLAIPSFKTLFTTATERTRPDRDNARPTGNACLYRV